MKILALETSTPACSVALLDGTEQHYCCIERFEIAPRKHTHLVLPMIDSVLNEAGYALNQIDVLAFGRGPGAFTGVRVATGVVQAISYGAELPVAQISTLAALAQGYHRTRGSEQLAQPMEQILIANDARMHELYFAAYELRGQFMTLYGQEQVIKPEQLSILLQQPGAPILLGKNWYTLGNGWSEYADQLHGVTSQCQCSTTLDEPFEFPHARDIAFLAFREISDDKLVSAERVRPVYLRDDVAKKSQNMSKSG